MTLAQQQVKDDIDSSKKMIRLLENEDFIELILEGFINRGLKVNVIDGNLDNSLTVDQLKARQILHRYLYDIITTGDKLQSH